MTMPFLHEPFTLPAIRVLVQTSCCHRQFLELEKTNVKKAPMFISHATAHVYSFNIVSALQKIKLQTEMLCRVVPRKQIMQFFMKIENVDYE